VVLVEKPLAGHIVIDLVQVSPVEIILGGLDGAPFAVIAGGYLVEIADHVAGVFAAGGAAEETFLPLIEELRSRGRRQQSGQQCQTQAEGQPSWRGK